MILPEGAIVYLVESHWRGDPAVPVATVPGREDHGLYAVALTRRTVPRCDLAVSDRVAWCERIQRSLGVRVRP